MEEIILLIALIMDFTSRTKGKIKRLNQFLRKAKVSSELEARRLETRLPLLVDKCIFQSLNSRHLYQTCSSQTS